MVWRAGVAPLFTSVSSPLLTSHELTFYVKRWHQILPNSKKSIEHMGIKNSVLTENSIWQEAKSFHRRISGHSHLFSTYSIIFKYIQTYFKILKNTSNFSTFHPFPTFKNFQQVQLKSYITNTFNIFQPSKHLFNLSCQSIFITSGTHLRGWFRLEMRDFYGKEGGIAIKRHHLEINPN